MGIVGRAREKALLDRILTSAEPAVCVVVGDPGVGKTALLVDAAQRHGASVTTVNRSERMWPYAGLSAIANALSGARGAAIDRILEATADWSDFRVADEVSRSLRATAGAAQLLLIDDIDEMDAASALALSYVLGRLQGTGLRVVATATHIDATQPFSSLPHHRLEPLDHLEAVELATTVLGPSTARGVSHLVATFTGGNPSAISRVRLTAHELSGESPVQLPLHLTDDSSRRSDVRDLLDQRPGALRVLDLLALAPETARSALLEIVPDEGSVIDDLIDAGVVDSHHDMLRIADPLRRLAVHTRSDARERLTGHADAAAAHRGLFRHLEHWHASFTEPVLEHEAALLASALRYARAGDITASVEFAERALAAPAAAPGRSAALIALSDVLWGNGCFALAELYLKRVTSFDREGLRLSGAVLSMRISCALDHVVDDATADGYVEAFGESDPAGCARVLDEVARLRIRRGEYAMARRRLAEAQGFLGAPGGVEHQLMMLVTGSGEGSDALTVPLMLPTSDADELAELSAAELVMLLRYLTMSEQYEVCRRKGAMHFERMLRPAPYWCELVRLMMLENELRSGDPIGTQEALAAWERVALVESVNEAARHLALTAAAAMSPDTDPDALHTLVAAGRELCLTERNTALTPFYAVIDGRRALSSGRYEEAVELFKEALSGRPVDDDQAVLRCAPDLVEALCLVDRHPEAFAVLAAMERAAQLHPSRWAEVAIARARAVCATADERSEAFAVALSRIAAHDSLDERRKLVAARQRIAGGSDGMRAAPPTNRATRAARLTPEELEVARLVNRGMRNREIAAALYVSVRTVELRLTHIYRKLGVRSRAHLVSVLTSE